MDRGAAAERARRALAPAGGDVALQRDHRHHRPAALARIHISFIIFVHIIVNIVIIRNIALLTKHPVGSRTWQSTTTGRPPSLALASASCAGEGEEEHKEAKHIMI